MHDLPTVCLHREAVSHHILVAAILVGLERGRVALDRAMQLRDLRTCYASLTPRERQVMALVVSGLLNEQVGGELGISELTLGLNMFSAEKSGINGPCPRAYHCGRATSVAKTIGTQGIRPRDEGLCQSVRGIDRHFWHDTRSKRRVGSFPPARRGWPSHNGR